MLSGAVVITGKPNVGKSTLINTLLNKKKLITSPKPQTTRNVISLNYIDESRCLTLIDTPGYHIRHNKFDDFLNTQIIDVYKTTKIALMMIDLTRPIDDEDEIIIENLKKFKIQHVVAILTKFDLSSEQKLNTTIEKLKKYELFEQYIHISSKQRKNLDNLLLSLDHFLTESTTPIEENELGDNFTISEIIREQVIFNTKQELPYSSTVVIDSNVYDKQANTLTIFASIIVEKESQKAIIIGAKGNMIKKIGTIARKELLNIYNCAIILKLFVKVEKDWRNNEHIIKSFYQKKV